MVDIILSCLLGGLTVAIAVLGGHVSSGSRRHKAAFYVMGGISIILIFLTGYRTYLTQKAAEKASERLDKTMTSLKHTSEAIVNMSKETVRIGRLNTQLQGRLLKQSKFITDLAKQSINTTTGGDSFGYLQPLIPWSLNSWTAIFIHRGKYPLYKVKARIIDLQKLKSITKPSSLSLLESANRGQTYLDLGDVAVGGAIMSYIPIQMNDAVEHSFQIYFSANNGSWVQSLILKGTSSEALQVYRWDMPTNTKHILLERIDPDISRNKQGQVDWPK